MPFSLVFYSFQVYSKVTLVLSWGNKSSPIYKVGYVRKQMSNHTGNLSRLVLFLILPLRLRTAGSPVFPAVPTLAPAVLQGHGGRGLLSLWRGLGSGWGDPMLLVVRPPPPPRAAAEAPDSDAGWFERIPRGRMLLPTSAGEVRGWDPERGENGDSSDFAELKWDRTARDASYCALTRVLEGLCFRSKLNLFYKILVVFISTVVLLVVAPASPPRSGF